MPDRPADDAVLTIEVFKTPTGYRARFLAPSSRSRVPPFRRVNLTGATPIEAVEKSLDVIRRAAGSYKGRGRKPNEYLVARWLR